MKIQCDCGQFQAEISHFPKNSAGRLACYCDDCQKYLKKLGREDLLDPYGGTEVIPVYPCDIKFLSGRENLKCNRLSEKGLNRWSTKCCNSPIANVKPFFPWVGVIHSAYTRKDPQFLENLGPIRSRIMGAYAHGRPPFKIPQKMDLNAIVSVLPFILKGKFLKKYKDSPFFESDGKTPIVDVTIL
ncbi:MAG: hypothetical protein KDD61_01910 [Bdellovibrionales bacterium]|nr:hypothetical protein [Bdellovibrionales bacterium]